MPVDPTSIPDDQPASPGFSKAFGFQIDSEAATAGMQQTIDTARQVSSAFGYTVSNGMMEQLADSAVFTDMLRGKVNAYLQSLVDQSRAVAGNLQQPIVTSIVNQLGATVEATMPMGVTLPQPGQEAPCPSCVTIRVSAESGDLGPAFACFRATVLPLRDSRGVDYARGLEYIEKCLPPDSATHNAFAVGIAAIIADPDALAPPILPAFDDPPIPQLPNPLLTTAPRTAPPVPVQDQNAYNRLIAAGYSPTTAAAAATAPGGIPVAFHPVMPPGSLPAAPGGAPTTGAPTAAPVSAGVIPGAPGSAIAFPFSRTYGSDCHGYIQAWKAGQFQWWGANGGRYYDPDFPGFDVIITWQDTTDPTGVPCREVWFTYAPGNPNSKGFVGDASHCACDAGGAPPTATTQPTQSPPQPQPSSPAPPAPPLPTQCPPPPCIPICKTERRDEKPPAPPCKYDLYCSSDHILYVVKKDAGSRSQFDTLIQSGDPAEFDWTSAARNCSTQPPTQQYTPPAGGSSALGAASAAGCGDLYRFQSLAGTPPGHYFQSLLNGLIDAAGPVTEFNWDVLNEALTGARDTILNAGGIFADAITSLTTTIPFVNCSGTQQEQIIIASKAVLGLFERWGGLNLPSTTIPLEYAQNSLCPYKIPSIGEALTAWLGNTIDETRLRCIVEANGGRWDSYSQVIDAARGKLSPQQYAFLFRRGLMDGPTLDNRLRNTGLTYQEDRNGVLELTRFIPPSSDIISMMTRDAADTKNIDWSKEDALFPDKFADPLDKWARWQGIDTEYMQMLWRAHFGIPAPGQLATMLHRLSRLPQNDPAYVSLDTVKQALIQQDISPKWVAQFVAISYNPLTRIDARRAYEVGALSESDLLEAYLNLGYDTPQAQQLVSFNKINITRTYLRRSEVTQLAKAEMSEAEFTQAMQQWGAQPDAIQAGIDRANILRSVASRKRCIDAYRKRYLIGEFDDQYAIQLVMGQQIELNPATVLVAGWTCEKNARGKLFTAQQLNGLYADGLIDEMDYVNRATRLGWDNTDAVLMLRQIQRKLNIKNTTQQAKDIAQQQKAADRLNRALARQAQRDAASRARAAAAVKSAQKLAILRTKRLTAAAEKFSVHSGLPLPDSIVLIQSVYQTALNTYPVTNDEVIGALTVITGDKDVVDQVGLVQALTTALTVQAS